MEKSDTQFVRTCFFEVTLELLVSIDQFLLSWSISSAVIRDVTYYLTNRKDSPISIMVSHATSFTTVFFFTRRQESARDFDGWLQFPWD